MHYIQSIPVPFPSADEEEPEEAVSDVEVPTKSKKKKKAKKSRESRISKRPRPVREVGWAWSFLTWSILVTDISDFSKEVGREECILKYNNNNTDSP